MRMTEHGFSHDDIAETAYFTWQQDNYVHGKDVRHWDFAIRKRTDDWKRDFPRLSQLYCEMPNRNGYGDWFCNLPFHVYSSHLAFEVYKYWLEPMLAELDLRQWNLYKQKLVKNSKQKRNQLFPLLNEVWGYAYLEKELNSRRIQFDTIDDPEAVSMQTTGMYPEWVASCQGRAVAVIEVKTVQSITRVTEQNLNRALMTALRPNKLALYPKAERQLLSVGTNRNLFRLAYIVLDLKKHVEPSVREADTLRAVRNFFNGIRRQVNVVVDIRLWPNRTSIYESFEPTVP